MLESDTTVAELAFTLPLNTDGNFLPRIFVEQHVDHVLAHRTSPFDVSEEIDYWVKAAAQN